MKILFISHSYPPIVGGVETQNYELSRWLGKITDCTILANKNRKLIPVFLPFAIIYTIFQAHKYDVIIFGSGLLGVVAWTTKLISKKPIIIVTHGLDLTYRPAWYQKLWVQKFIPSADKLIAVGNETINAGVSRGIANQKFVFIPNGVDTEKNLTEASRADLEKILGISVAGKKILLTSGRLAKRKGVAWFVREVMPKLPSEYLYVVAGNGPDKENIAKAIAEQKMESRVLTLGYVTDKVRNQLWAVCDLFVQPNIKIAGDMEGFGISVIEAGACRLPVLASNLEGLKDAIKEGRSGFLIEPENAQAYVEKIQALFVDGSPREIFGSRVRDFVLENFQWKEIAKRYLEEIEKVVH